MCVCVCVCVRACVRTRAQSYLTLCDPMDCCLPGASVHGILQARILEWEIFIFEFSIGLPVTVRCMVWSDDLLPNPASSPPPFLSEMSDSHHWVEDFPCPVLLQSPLNCHRFGPNKHLNLQFISASTFQRLQLIFMILLYIPNHKCGSMVQNWLTEEKK